MIPPFNHCRLAALVFLSIGLLQGSCLASPNAPDEFRLYTRPLVISERGTVTSYVLQTSKARFSFLPPSKWAVKENATTKEVVMMARNLITSIRFKIVGAAPEATNEPSKVKGPTSEVGQPPQTLEALKAQWRQSVQENHPDGRITAEFPCYTGKIEGAALDLERIAPNKAKVFTRLAFIPLPDGRVEFDLTTTSANLAETRLAFGNFLTSFRVDQAAAPERSAQAKPPAQQ
jgi:hypothetical protein